jgi:hypothetical protein
MDDSMADFNIDSNNGNVIPDSTHSSIINDIKNKFKNKKNAYNNKTKQ